MSDILLPCHSCGATRGNALSVWEIRGEGWRVGCVNEKCVMAKVVTHPYPTEAEAITAWNRRYVRLDKNGKAVFAGDEVKITASDSSDGCEGKIQLLVCIPIDGVPMPVEYLRENGDAEGITLEIELVKT